VKAVAAATLAARASAQGASPNEQVTLGCIGVGSHGTSWNMKAFLQIPEARILAVCDVFDDRADDARQIVNRTYKNRDCTTYRDFRELLARDDIDAVVISTPDHWHVPMSVMSAKAGKHVFCEKPTLTIREGQLLQEVIKKTGVVYQGGIEDRSVVEYHRMAELARNGALGKLKQIKMALPEGEVYPIEKPVPVPKGLDWDLWQGPAPEAPYTPTRTGKQEWRNIRDYSGGKLTDWGAHLMDTAQIALFEEHGGPVEVEGKGDYPENSMSTAATKFELTYRYANGVEMHVVSGGTGLAIFGEDGWVGNKGWRQPLEASDPAILEAVFAEADNRMWPLPNDEHRTFIDGVLGGPEPYYSPEDIHRLSTVMHIGNISMELGRKLAWDPSKETFPDDPEANALQSRPMRDPWAGEMTV
jgi:predicted dehydrogenase